jgi:hypothetical protein
MKYLLSIFIFSIVLFLYLHIQYHVKTSNDLEIYTIIGPTKERLEEMCGLRQPVIFNYHIENIATNCNLAMLDDNYSAFDVRIRNTFEHNSDGELHLPLLLTEAVKLFQSDKEGKFITESNVDFLEETGVSKNYKYNDAFLRPPMVSKCIYDWWSGSIGSMTPLRYHNSYRNYFYLTSGKVSIKLIPPIYAKYLDITKDYENGEYRSQINPWKVHDLHKAEFNKVKVLDIVLNEGDILSIPPYWNYSIRYEELSSICVLQYRTYMNTVSILPDLVLNLLQKNNITRKTVSGITTKVLQTVSPDESIPDVIEKTTKKDSVDKVKDSTNNT